jgi:hypothetical protein
VGQAPGHGVPRGPFTAAAVTRTVGFDDPAREDCALGLKALAGDDELKLVEEKVVRSGRANASVRSPTVASDTWRFFQDERVGAFPSGDLDIYPGTAAPQLHPHLAKSRPSRDYTPVPGSRSSVEGSAITADGGS